MSLVELLEAVATCPELRSAHNALVGPVGAFWASLPLSDGLWRALQAVAGSDHSQLDEAQRRYLELTVDEFKRHGATLGADAKRRLGDIDVALSQLTTRFAQNVLDSTNEFEIVTSDEARVAGLPESARQAARQSAAVKGLAGYRFTLQAPSLNAVLTYADDSALRQKVYLAQSTLAIRDPYDNRPLLGQILALRRQKAEMLGFKDFADLVMEPRMAKSGQAAQHFVADLTARTEDSFRQENADLLQFRRQLEGSSAPELHAWDIAYYAEKLRRHRCDFDGERLREYFPFEQTLGGLFRLAQDVFDVHVEQLPGVQTWDESVKCYELKDADGRTAGAFYVDPFPRETKRSGAWMHGLVNATSSQPGVAGVFTNASPPTGNRPALLTHRDVQTLFHEFGHLLHHCLSRVPVRGLSGTRVAQDFVELPSQIMENWCWEREALDRFARHYATTEPIPQDLFAALREVRTFRAANDQMRQLGFAAVDLALHIDYDESRHGDVIDFSRTILQRYSPAPLGEAHARIASLGHLFAHPVGYAAGYYSYKWAEVLDADAFTRFKSEGIFNRNVGQRFRCNVLERGNGRDPMRLFREFMGRPPELGALLARLGLPGPERSE
jgi:oligopeptidase A